MKIYQLNLKCYSLSEMKQFYTEVLEMALLSESDQHFTILAGATKILFELDHDVPYYHICFRTGSDYFNHIFNKLEEKQALLPDEEGHYSMFWEGKQAYFFDPDGNILEALERPFHWGEDSPEKRWYDVGEIGMPVKHICDFHGELSHAVPTLFDKESDTFAFYGDSNGVFVLVKEGRNWYPTERKSAIHPTTVIVSGENEGKFKHPELPYTVIVQKEWNENIPD
jgi:catechol 2,3-dioxygenase-like lactoylglutathione lyase family enzyme